ncbi:MAG: amino acid carrier protein [Eubacteriales bacterium]
MLNFLSFINTYVFGPALPLVMIICGGFFIVRLRGFYIFHPAKVCGALANGGKGEKSSFRALSVALAGTLGVGNIAGVAAAVTAGGAGALFWMWISALCAMALKYAETSLSIRFRGGGCGAFSYISRCFKGGRAARIISSIFAVLCLGASFSIGSVVQINAAAKSLSRVFAIPELVCGALFAAVAAAVVFGGFSRISSVTARLVPPLCAVYIVLCAAMLISGRAYLGGIMRDIFAGAFDLGSAAGGIGGFLLMRSLRFGVARGVLSNEAGCGTSPFAHAEADAPNPAAQGCFGIFEVFCDTVILCTLTGLCTLIFLKQYPECAIFDGIPLSLMVFENSFGCFGGMFLAISTALFALASYLCWAFYGAAALSALTVSPGARKVYLALYCISAFYAAAASSEVMWQLADLSVSAMAMLNVACLCRMSGEVSAYTKEYFT